MPPTDTTKVYGDRYEVVQFLAKGGFGAVYKVRDRNFRQRYVALKVLNTSAIESEELAAAFLSKFEDEANVQVGLRHPGIVPVYDYRSDPSAPFIVMELIEGGTLSDLLKQRRLEWPEVVELGIQVAEALHHAHTHGVTAHRDIKPANIFCPEPRRYLVGDFGIARVQPSVGATVTRSVFGTAGTPAYMAPEQILAPGRVDGRTDQLALAAVLFEVLAARRPYSSVVLEDLRDDEAAERIVAAAYAKRPDLCALNPAVPPSVAAVIHRALEPDQARRYDDCAAFAAALRQAALEAQPAKEAAPQIPPVFICHAPQDHDAAAELCGYLEAAGLRCWIAPRDVTPGASYVREVAGGIDAAGVLTLLLTRHAAESQMVAREIEWAVKRNKRILPICLEEVDAASDLEFLLPATNSIDARNGRLKECLDKIHRAIRREPGGNGPTSDAGQRKSAVPSHVPEARVAPTAEAPQEPVRPSSERDGEPAPPAGLVSDRVESLPPTRSPRPAQERAGEQKSKPGLVLSLLRQGILANYVRVAAVWMSLCWGWMSLGTPHDELLGSLIILSTGALLATPSARAWGWRQKMCLLILMLPAALITILVFPFCIRDVIRWDSEGAPAFFKLSIILVAPAYAVAAIFLLKKER